MKILHLLVIISYSYLPPIWYLNALATNESSLLDGYEFFVKQTIRNRCHILSPNGIQTLVVPVVHNNRTKTIMKDIQISYDLPWQRQHWRSLNAAYRRSAFFEFYMDDLAPFYHREFKFLSDLNLELLEFLLKAIHLKPNLAFTEKYEPTYDSNVIDFREKCNNGVPQPDPVFERYVQVFSDRHDFKAGLSVIDLLFNAGPQAASYLQR